MNRITFFTVALLSANALHIHAGNSQLRINGVNIGETSKAFAQNALRTSVCTGIAAGSAWIIKQENLPIENPTLRMGIKAGAGFIGALAAGSVMGNTAAKYKLLYKVSRAKQLYSANDNTGWNKFCDELKPDTQRICARATIAEQNNLIEQAKQDGTFSQSGWAKKLNRITTLEQKGTINEPWFADTVNNTATKIATEMATGSYYKHQAWAALAGIFTGAATVATACYKMGLFSRLWS